MIPDELVATKDCVCGCDEVEASFVCRSSGILNHTSEVKQRQVKSVGLRKVIR